MFDPNFPDDVDDGEQVKRAIEGDLAAFEKLFHKYSVHIGRHIVHIVKNHEDMQDIAQETFKKAWRQLSTLQNRSRFKSWLYVIATREALDHLRRRKPRKEASRYEVEENNLEVEDEGENPEDRAITAIIFEQALEATRKRVRPALYTCLVLHSKGLTVENIAQKLGLEPNTVRTYLSKVHRILREEFQYRLNH